LQGQKCVEIYKRLYGEGAVRGSISIGSWNLATTSGYLYQIGHLEVVQAINKIIDAGRKTRHPWETVGDAKHAAKHIEMGCKLLTLGADNDYLIRRCKLSLEVMKSLK